MAHYGTRWALLAALVLTVLVQVVAVYTPFFQSLLGTVALPREDWILLVLVGAPHSPPGRPTRSSPTGSR